ncbi:E3 ubiquitin ligase [Rhizophlyctis rosea]|nr:E3 ubiquitin ligase [Rhizophlyctis rosea]
MTDRTKSPRRHRNKSKQTARQARDDAMDGLNVEPNTTSARSSPSSSKATPVLSKFTTHLLQMTKEQSTQRSRKRQKRSASPTDEPGPSTPTVESSEDTAPPTCTQCAHSDTLIVKAQETATQLELRVANLESQLSEKITFMDAVLAEKMVELEEVQSLLGRFKSSLTCPICLDNLTLPHTLPCGHTFCFTCLHAWTTSQTQRPHRHPLCPSCRTPITTAPYRCLLTRDLTSTLPHPDAAEQKRLEDRVRGEEEMYRNLGEGWRAQWDVEWESASESGSETETESEGSTVDDGGRYMPHVHDGEMVWRWADAVGAGHILQVDDGEWDEWTGSGSDEEDCDLQNAEDLRYADADESGEESGGEGDGGETIVVESETEGTIEVVSGSESESEREGQIEIDSESEESDAPPNEMPIERSPFPTSACPLRAPSTRGRARGRGRGGGMRVGNGRLRGNWREGVTVGGR